MRSLQSPVILTLLGALAACNGTQEKPPENGGPDTYEKAMHLGQEALAEGQLVQAADLFRTARGFQETADARFLEHSTRARIAADRGADVEALEQYDLALEAKKDPDTEAAAGRLRSKVAAEAKPPEIEITEPADGSTVQSTPVVVAGRILPGEGSTVTVLGQSVPVKDGAFRASVSLQDGANTIAVIGERFGKRTEKTLKVAFKPKGPAISLASPTDGTWTGAGDIEVRGRVADPSAEVTVSGAAAKVAPDGSFQATVPLETEGANEILVRAQVSGGEAAIHRIRVFRDAAPPVIKIVQPANNAIVQGDSVQVLVEVSDRGELAKVTIGERDVTVRDGRASIEIPMSSEWATIRATAKDRAGHEASAEVYVLKRPVPKGWEYVGPNPAGFHEVKNPKDGAVFVWIPPGPFDRGSEEGDANEKPRMKIELSGYLIGKAEVTQGQFAQFCRETGRTPPPRPQGAADDHPVSLTHYRDALAYAEWAGCRLPTEAQWEKATGWDEKSGRSRQYPWGDEGPEQGGKYLANYDPNPPDADGAAKTSPVGRFPQGASPCGALDMGGNVWEWCLDYYDPSAYVASPEKDPTGPPSGIERVIRGGSFSSEWEGELRVPARRGARPDLQQENLGFRLAKPLSDF